MTESVPPFITYQLLIRLPAPVRLRIGALGLCDFPAERYCYTGSARRHFEARIARHLRREKTLRWHVDYLLAAPEAEVTEVIRSHEAECDLNAAGEGRIIMAGFGASDCRAGCGSHLKYLGGL